MPEIITKLTEIQSYASIKKETTLKVVSLSDRRRIRTLTVGAEICFATILYVLIVFQKGFILLS